MFHKRVRNKEFWECGEQRGSAVEEHAVEEAAGDAEPEGPGQLGQQGEQRPGAGRVGAEGEHQ